MGRRPRYRSIPEEKWQIVQEGIKSGNIWETCRRDGLSPSLLYRWRNEAEAGAGAKAALGAEKRCLGRDREGPAHPAVPRISLAG